MSRPLRAALLLLALGGLTLPVELCPPARAAESQPASSEPEVDLDAPRGLWARTAKTLRLVGSYRYQRPTLGGVNPENALLDVPRQTAEAEARLDLSLELDRLAIFAKPRARWTREHRQDGPSAGRTGADAEVRLNEGAAKLRAVDSLFGSFGRENLQGGPGQLVNPSNPFFAENGRENPVRELPGMDFVRAVWLPASSWTLSWISNTGRGEAELGGREWRPSQAVKLEHVGKEANGGVLLHGGPDDPTSLRAYGQRTASDALLLYAEASASRGTRALYPVRDRGPLGGHLEPLRKGDPTPLLFGLLGGASTLELGPTLSAEYVFNDEGYHRREADLFFDIGARAGRLAAEGLLPRGAASSNRLRLLRRHYLFLQYLQTEIANRATLLVRRAQNLDDRSGLTTLFFDYALSDRWRAFGFAAAGDGGNRDEFGSVLRYSASAGLEFSAF
ncbi:MAG: hypothetical protein HY900_35520 [Deltaproteobacteria bacterium]|nr:hypothetical protein [Deltaproteobacteria bacterium]